MALLDVSLFPSFARANAFKSITQGCIRNLYIDNKLYGLPEVDVTSNITTGCMLKSKSKEFCGLNCPDEGNVMEGMLQGNRLYMCFNGINLRREESGKREFRA